MAEVIGGKAQARERQQAAEVFLGALVKGAKTVTLYKPGHPLIMQICERVNATLRAAIGQEPNLTFEIKAKQVLFNESPLADGEETLAFAAALHTLGIGQTVFSTRVVNEGLYEFMKMLVAKPEPGQTLTDLQKAVQGARIDGMQLVFILSFVVTGEDEQAKQKPGNLNEEQVRAFIAARNLPDFLRLLMKQNEPLTSKEAEELTALLDQTLNREASLGQLEAGMPWSLYDPRIRRRWDGFLAEIRGDGPRTRELMVSELSTASDAELAALKDHHSHEAKDALRFALDKTHALLESPAGEKQPKYVTLAYARLLVELGRAGDLEALQAEAELVRRLSAEGAWAPLLPALSKTIQDKVPSAALAEKAVARLLATAGEAEGMRRLIDFVLWLGPGMAPLLLDELRRLSDKNGRKWLCALLAQVCRQSGPQPIYDALEDEDYFLVTMAIGIIAEMGLSDGAKRTAPLLKHKHAKVRETAIRTLGRFGGKTAVDGLFAFISAPEPLDEARLAVTTLSLIPEPGVDARLAEACRKTGEYDVKIAIAGALGRFPGPAARELLSELARFNWWEWLTGRNKELRQAAKRSLEQVRKELRLGAQAG